MALVKNTEALGGYFIDVKPATKTIEMKVEGTFTPQQAEQFHKDYEKQTTSVAANEYTLNVDCKTMKVIDQSMTPALTHSFELYKSTGFKKVCFLIEKKGILKMQLDRIARTAGLTNYEIIES